MTHVIEPHPIYPTPEHEATARIVVDHFSRQPATEAILLVGSCARSKAVPGSCVDIAVLVRAEVTSEERTVLEQDWQRVHDTEPSFAAMLRHGPFAHVDLEIIDGSFEPTSHGWTSGPDDLELEIGNFLAYSVPLWQRGNRYEALRAQWLPYYAEALRIDRLDTVTRFCRNNLEHIPVFVDRGLYFQAFDRLYKAFGEFLQTLFIARSIYPIAYDKWFVDCPCRRSFVETVPGHPLVSGLPLCVVS